MEDTNALECFMALLDENQRILEKDFLGEASDILDYQIREGEKKPQPQRSGSSFAAAISRPVIPVPSGTPQTAMPPMEEDVSSCHSCRACMNRQIFAEPILNPSPRILFVAPSPEGPSIFDPASYDYFIKWINSIGLRRKDIALTALIKCPVPTFDRGAADACRSHLRSEMASLRPSAMVLLGQDAASYMLRRQGDFNTVFRQKRFTVNNIPVFCTYTPHQLYMDRGLRGPVWQDLQFVASSIGLEVKR